ncbi:phage tail tape measure protein [Clostridium sp.]|jgi:TP901 family phage tail tape measure protein|uniref:phage tail tape measure protein n=1 Tax=Clostridium sp. TaxID=1506 RepID=UPI003EEA48FD
MSRTISTILSMQDKMSPKLVTVSGRVAGMSTEMQRASRHSVNMANKFGKNMMGMADKIVKTTVKFAALGALIGAGIVLKVGIEGLKELDEAAAKVKSIAGANLEKTAIKAGLLQASNTTGVNTTELADTQYNAISSGVSTKDSLAASVSSSKLAKAGFTDSNSALKILTSTMNVYGLKGQEAMNIISDKLLMTQNLGVTTVAELGESMGSLTPIANSAGLSIDELLSGMVGLTKNGLKTDEATVSLKGIMTSIIKPTSDSAKMAQKLGIDFSVAGLKSKGFAGFMEDVKKKTGGSTEKMAGLFGNVRALSGALVLTGGGLKDTENALDKMKDSTGATDKAFEIMENTMGAKMEKLKNRFKNTATSIVDTQSGMMGKIADKMITWLNDNEGNIQKWVDDTGKAIVKVYDGFKKIIDFVIEHKTVIEDFGVAFLSFYAAIKVTIALSTAMNGLKIAVALTDGVFKMTTFGKIVLGLTAVIAAVILAKRHWTEIKKVFEDNKTVIGATALVLSVILGPALVAIGAKATLAGAKITVNFIGGLIKSSAAMIANAAVMTGTMVLAITSFIGKLALSSAAIVGQTLLLVAQKVGLISSATALDIAIVAQAAYNAILLANPIILIIAGLVALGIAIYEVVKHWKGICTWIGKAWDWLTKWNGTKAEDKDTTVTTKYVNGREKQYVPNIPKHATGTNYSSAGLALIHEKGGEIRKLSSGETIIPADKSKQLIDKAGNGDVKVYVTIQGNVMGNEEYADYVGNHIGSKIKLALGNM